MPVSDEQIAVAIGQNLQRYRRSKGWSQEVLGKKLGVSRQRITDFESGIAIPKTVVLIRAARVFNVPVDRLCLYSIE